MTPIGKRHVLIGRRGDATVRLSGGELRDAVAGVADALPDRAVHHRKCSNSVDDVLFVLACRLRGETFCLFSEFTDPPTDLHTAPPPPPGIAGILWTSGTTARPRGVMLTQQNLDGNAAAKLAAVPQGPDDIRITPLSIAHAYALTCDVGTWLIAGGTLAVVRGWNGLIELAPRLPPTLINAVPMIADRLLRLAGSVDLDRLRLLGCGGAAMTTDTFEAWRRRGVTVIQGYGLTETSPVICSQTPASSAAGRVGQPVAGWETKVIGEQLYVRGPHVMAGYWNDPSATAERIDADGWLSTRDRVAIDPAGDQFQILGRIDDVIVLPDGSKLDPVTIERTVERVAGVRHAMLIDRDGLELWIDGDAAERSVRSAAKLHRPFRVHRFAPRLDVKFEVTAKGTIKRGVIRRERFGCR